MSFVFPVDAMEEDELRAGPWAVGGAAGGGGLAVGVLDLATEGAGAAPRVVVVSCHGVHEELRPAETLGFVHRWRSCTSRSALQAR